MTSAGEVPRSLPERTGHALIKLGETLNVLAEHALAPLGLRGKHLHVLTLVRDHRLSQQELAELVGMDRTSMVALIDDLERLGLATRQRSETDRRRYLIVPTPAAEDTLRECAELLDRAEARLFGELTTSEYLLLREIVKRLLVRVNDAGTPNGTADGTATSTATGAAADSAGDP
ncbi:MAG TPA: MarR family transcriptional regulator [Pseudonocardiaceae bacterium]|nr:MarR family transcriptional regulator [Pseudonocardiaceae bacterium]